MKRFIKDVKEYAKYSMYSAKSELKSEVANSYLNWLWWILDPICFMVIYTFIFGYVFGAKELYFPVFIFIGLSMWDFFSRSITNSIKIVRNNKSIVSKVYLPKFVLLFVKLLVNGFKMLISFIIVVLMMIVFQVPLSWNVLYFIPIMLVLILFTFGCTTHLLHFGVFVEDLSNVMTIVLRLLFYITGIFYNVESRIEAPYSDYIMKLNPMAFLLSSMRKALIYGQTPHRKMLILWFLISLVIAALGVRNIYKNENSYVKVI